MKVTSSSPKGARLKREMRKLTEILRVSGKFRKERAHQIESDTFLALCEAVNSPVSLGAWLRYKHNEFLELVNAKVDPCNYTDKNKFMGDYLSVSFFSKYPDFNTGIDKENVAFQKWLSAEESCRETNELFRSRWSGGISYLPHSVEEVIHFARIKIQQILGPVPSDILTHGRFGPGSDTSTYRDSVSRYYKYRSPGSCTPGVQLLINQFDWDDKRADLVNSATLVNNSRLTFVPKSAKTDRAICVEPRWNIFFQLSVGAYMENRLADFGFDISDQGRNVELAQRAYFDGFSTIDLSSASDRISKNLVLDLLPDDWCDIIFKLRCPTTVYRDKVYKLEKVSSMGNGFTFPLETLIFAGLSLATCSYLNLPTENVAVYGDDIIVPKEAAPLLIEVLSCLGFPVNTEKTYISGNFFESCGSDFFEGKNVRPIFHKRRIRNVEGAVRLANQVTEYARRVHCFDHASARYLVAKSHIVSRIPKELQFFGPVNAGDSVIHSTFDSCTPRTAGNGWQGYFIRGIVVKPQRFFADGEALLHSKIDAADLPGNFVTRRGRTQSTVEEVYVLEFEDFVIR